jgi:hypothetical protein
MVENKTHLEKLQDLECFVKMMSSKIFIEMKMRSYDILKV